MKNLNVIFMGTPEFSVPILKELIDNTNVIMVVTRPDALIGRKKVLTPCSVKTEAINNNIKSFSPTNIKEEYNDIINMHPDIIITCAYGQIVPDAILSCPKYGCINIHASLLPKYRGGAPIHHAIMNGDDKTGITIMKMAPKMDAGDIIIEEEIPILNDDTLGSLSNKLSNLGSKMIIDLLPKIINGSAQSIKQDETKVTFAPIIKRSDEHINFNDTAINIYNKIRALNPEPLANFVMDDIEYKVGSSIIINKQGKPGVCDNDMVITCTDKAIKILTIKPMGKNMMSVKDFKNGYHCLLEGKIIK